MSRSSLVDLSHIVNNKPLNQEENSKLRNWSNVPVQDFLQRKPAMNRSEVRQALCSYSENRYSSRAINNESDSLAYGIIKVLMLITVVATVIMVTSHHPKDYVL
ncbi:hypothetical protein EON63_02695 [archaeon]|nr:MAG: hypothetical protein EON63_02695 [archaeon]